MVRQRHNAVTGPASNGGMRTRNGPTPRFAFSIYTRSRGAKFEPAGACALVFSRERDVDRTRACTTRAAKKMLCADAVREHATEPEHSGDPTVGCATDAEADAVPESDDPEEVLLHYMNRDATWFRYGPLAWDLYTKLPRIVNVIRTRGIPDPELYSRMAPREGWHEPNPFLSETTLQPDQVLNWKDRQLLYVWRLAGNEERRLHVMRTHQPSP